MAAERILISGVTEVLKKLVPAIAQEIGSAWGVEDELKKLQGTLEMIHAVIADAQRRQVREDAVRLWLRKLKGIAYDADDVIDEFSYKAMRRRERQILENKVGDFFTTSGPLAFPFKMAKKIRDINHQLDKLTKDMDRFQLKTIPTSSTTVHVDSSERRSRQSTSFASQSHIVGRENDRDKLIKILTTFTTSSSTSLSNNDNYNPEVLAVSIVGMGGLGKTTLAQLVYNDDSVKQHFEPKIWVCVSNDFDVYRILSDIMESITQQKFSELSNFDVLVRKVREQLTGKRYLIVLDDLWNEDAEQWERLQSSLIVGAQGSKILITTRKRQAADVVKGSIPPYFLEKLQSDECWSIMERKAFSPGGALQNPEMTRIGKEIANKCSGLPLAAKFLGSLMHSKNKESNWLSIRENDVWNTPESQSKIIPILKLSYDNLSPHLQRCFSYCSIFPKDWELSKQTLIQLWMAEGFLQPLNMGGSDCSFEDIGEEYFESLMWSSFFDGVKKNDLDDVTTFKMHDLVHDLARDVAGDDELASLKVSEFNNTSKIRRLHLTLDADVSSAFLKSLRSAKKLRTVFIPEGSKLDPTLFSGNKYLRILHVGRSSIVSHLKLPSLCFKLRHLRYLHLSFLDLREVESDQSINTLYNLETLVLSDIGNVENLLSNIQSLQKLRYLEVSWTDMIKLPESITSLSNLQTLDFNHSDIKAIPDSISCLKNLKSLNLSFNQIEELPISITTLSNLETLDINSCKNLKTLPEYVAGLAKLRIFDFKNCPLLEALPKDFGVLTHLRYLSLKGCDQIRVLPDSCSTNLNNLEYVHLQWCALPKEVTKWIQLRKFYYYKMETPKGIGKLVWLQELRYNVRERVKNELECDDGIDELGNLNSLERLSIWNLENVKDPIDAENANLKGKQNLRELVLHWVKTEEDLGMRWDQTSCNFQVFEDLQPPSGLRDLRIINFMGCDLPTWMCVPSGLPNLESLALRNCGGIKQLPASIGQLPCLRSLELKRLSLKCLDIGGFPSLIELVLTDLFLLEELRYSYPSLRYLWIIGCKNLTEIPSFPSLGYLELEKVDPKLVCSVGRSQVTSLTQLFLKNIEDLVYLPISILQNNRNLQLLQIEKCNQFQGFRVIDDENENVVAPLLVPDLYSTVSLQKLEFMDCPDLKFLPDLRGGWTSLQKLLIFNCPQVKESLTYDLKSLSFLKDCMLILSKETRSQEIHMF